MNSRPNDLHLKLRQVWQSASTASVRIREICESIDAASAQDETIASSIRDEIGRLQTLQGEFIPLRQQWRESNNEKTEELTLLETKWKCAVDEATESVRRAEQRLRGPHASLLDELSRLNGARVMLDAYGRR